MLDVNPDTVCRLVELAHEFHSQDEVTIPDITGEFNDEWAVQTLAEYDSDMTFQEFKAIVEDLEPRQQQEVVAMLWIGRGDYSLEEWDEALQQAAGDWTPRTAEYLIIHPLLAGYLEEALEQLGHRCG